MIRPLIAFQMSLQRRLPGTAFAVTCRQEERRRQEARKRRSGSTARDPESRDPERRSPVAEFSVLEGSLVTEGEFREYVVRSRKRTSCLWGMAIRTLTRLNGRASQPRLLVFCAAWRSCLRES